jgi:hypothetical protein
MAAQIRITTITGVVHHMTGTIPGPTPTAVQVDVSASEDCYSELAAKSIENGAPLSAP